MTPNATSPALQKKAHTANGRNTPDNNDAGLPPGAETEPPPSGAADLPPGAETEPPPSGAASRRRSQSSSASGRGEREERDAEGRQGITGQRERPVLPGAVRPGPKNHAQALSRGLGPARDESHQQRGGAKLRQQRPGKRPGAVGDDVGGEADQPETNHRAPRTAVPPRVRGLGRGCVRPGGDGHLSLRPVHVPRVADVAGIDKGGAPAAGPSRPSGASLGPLPAA